MANECLTYQSELSKVAEAVGLSLGDRMRGISDKYSREGGVIKDDAENQAYIIFDVSWDNVSIIFDIPEFKMVTQEWKIDLPQVTMVNREMIFHTPSARMENQKVGQYPEFHGLNVEWKDIIITVPVFFMEEQRIVVGIPEFTIDTTSIILDIPEVTMKTQEIIMGLPQFTLKEAYVDIQIRATELKDRATAEVAVVRGEIAKQAGSDFARAANTLFSCLRTSIQNKRLESGALIEPAITMLQSSISKFESIDSAESRQMVSDLKEKLGLSLQKKQDLELTFQKQIDALIIQEQKVVSDFINKLSN